MGKLRQGFFGFLVSFDAVFDQKILFLATLESSELKTHVKFRFLAQNYIGNDPQFIFVLLIFFVKSEISLRKWLFLVDSYRKIAISRFWAITDPVNA